MVFNPIKLLNKRTFKKNKGRNGVAALAILMTTLMFTTLFTLAQSMNKNMIEMTFRQTGYDAQVSLKKVTEEEIRLIEAHSLVREVGQSIVLGLAENEELGGKQVEIRWADESYASHSFTLPTMGTMPQKDNEIAVDTSILNKLGIPHELGQTITIHWRKDLTKDEITSSTFTLCGFWEGNESLYAGMAWVSKDFANEMIANETSNDNQIMGIHTAQVSLKKDTSIEADMNKIFADAGIANLDFHINLAYSDEMGANIFQESAPMYLGMLLVFVAGFLIIYNIFQISVTAEIQFYGKLKTLGTTSKQIKRLIYGQANRICILGIPLGLLFGWLLGIVLVPILMGMNKSDSVISVNPVIFIGSALFAWITVILSCMRPAYMAGKISPMEALRMNDTKGSKKKNRKSNSNRIDIHNLAWGNLLRNKKRTVMVVCSLTLGLVLLSCFYAKNASFDMDKYLEHLTIADFELSDVTNENYMQGYNPKGNTINEDLVTRIEELEGIEEIGHQYSYQTVWQMDHQTAENMATFYTKDKIADWKEYDARGAEQVAEAISSKTVIASIQGIDGIPLHAVTQEQYILEGAFNQEQFDTGNYILVFGPSIDKEGQHPVLPTPTVGEQIELEGKAYTVMAVLFPLSSVYQGAPEQGLMNLFEMKFIIPASQFKEQWPENTLRKIYVNMKAEQVLKAQEMLDEYVKTVDASLPVISRKTVAEQYEAETGAAAVMGNAISIIIALVGVLNFINSMVTAIVSRKREFAMIQSVGMTKKQLCKMLVLEGLFYAIITLIISYIMSALAVGIGVQSMVAGGLTTFKFTLFPLVICTPLLLAFAIVIPYICFKNIDKQSIVERLRIEG